MLCNTGVIIDYMFNHCLTTFSPKSRQCFSVMVSHPICQASVITKLVRFSRPRRHGSWRDHRCCVPFSGGRCCHEINFQLKQGNVFPERKKNMWKSQMFLYELLPRDFWEACFQVSSRGCNKKVVIHNFRRNSFLGRISITWKWHSCCTSYINVHDLCSIDIIDIIWHIRPSSNPYSSIYHACEVFIPFPNSSICTISKNSKKIYPPWN